MIPYKEIWDNIELIQNFNVGFNLKKDKNLYKILNDLLGIRFIFKSSREELQKIRETFTLRVLWGQINVGSPTLSVTVTKAYIFTSS